MKLLIMLITIIMIIMIIIIMVGWFFFDNVKSKTAFLTIQVTELTKK